jgi:hypothetical protein
MPTPVPFMGSVLPMRTPPVLSACPSCTVEFNESDPESRRVFCAKCSYVVCSYVAARDRRSTIPTSYHALMSRVLAGRVLHTSTARNVIRFSRNLPELLLRQALIQLLYQWVILRYLWLLAADMIQAEESDQRQDQEPRADFRSNLQILECLRLPR